MESLKLARQLNRADDCLCSALIILVCNKSNNELLSINQDMRMLFVNLLCTPTLLKEGIDTGNNTGIVRNSRGQEI